MESITGIRFTAEPTAEVIKECSCLSAAYLRYLTETRAAVYNQILYPYADTLSLSGMPGAESTRIFGTHMLLRGIGAAEAEAAAAEVLPSEAPPREYRAFTLTDGAAKSADIAAFLREGAESGLPSVGDFSEMLGGYVTHWRIRECARVYASFSEMAYRRAKGEIIGLCGGRLILTPECDCREALSSILTQKTGTL